NHFAFAFADSAHIDCEFTVCAEDAELTAALEVRGDLGAVNHVFAGQARDVGQDPPIYLRSMTATRRPSPANVHAATVPPVPPPRMTMSNSSVAVVGATCIPYLLEFSLQGM